MQPVEPPNTCNIDSQVNKSGSHNTSNMPDSSGLNYQSDTSNVSTCIQFILEWKS